MIIPALDIPNDTEAIINRQTNEITLSMDKIRSRMIYEAQPTNKVFNSTKLDLSKIDDVIKKFISDFKEKKDIFLDKENPIDTVELIKNMVVSFGKCTANLLLINPEKIGIEVTTSKTLYFFARKGNYKIHLESFFEHQLENEQFELVLNVFDNKGPVLSTSGNPTSVIKAMNDLFTQEHKTSYLDYIENSSFYAVSSGHFTQD